MKPRDMTVVVKGYEGLRRSTREIKGWLAGAINSRLDTKRMAEREIESAAELAGRKHVPKAYKKPRKVEVTITYIEYDDEEV